MKIKALLLVAALSGCASAPLEPAVEPETQTAAAVVNPGFWRWLGRAVLVMLNNVTVQVKVEANSEGGK